MPGIGTAIAGGIATGAGGALAGRLVGGSAPRIGKGPREINLPGLTARRRGRGFNVTRTADAQSALDEIRDIGQRQAGEIRSMADEVQPGVGRLTEARTDALGVNRRRTIGNLREQLQRRRVLGSSFGADTVSRAEAEFAQKEDQVRAESFMQELEVRNQLLNQAFEAEARGAATELQQLGVEQQVAANLVQSMTGAQQRASIANAEIRSAASAGAGKLIGTLGGIYLQSVLGGGEDDG